MSKLITRQPKRIFSFGCSFTRYNWSTWPEVIAYDLDIPLINYGRSGAGNQFIANMVCQADAEHNFNEDDLVMVAWTNVCREDKWRRNDWVTPGNIFTQGEYDEKYVRKWSDPVGYMIRDFSSVKLIGALLENKKCMYHFLAMCNIAERIDQSSNTPPIKTEIYDRAVSMYRPDLEKIKSSFFEVLWQNEVHQHKMVPEIKILGKYFSDGHPNPEEHLKYLQIVFPEHEFRQETIDKTKQAQSNFISFIHKMNDRYKRNYAVYELTLEEKQELRDLTLIKGSALPEYI